MADQLLSIDSSNLESVAGAIRTKAGLSNSQKLVFPDTDEQGKLGMVTALQGITTEATVTPKISAQQVTLTKDSTSFSISPGFHDGNGTVGITLQSKTVTPNSSQQEVVPDTGKLLSQVIVNAMGSGYRLVQGTATYSNQESITLSGYGFTAAGFVVMNTDFPSTLPSSGAGTYVMALFTSNDGDSDSYSWNPMYLEAYSSGVYDNMSTADSGKVTNNYNSLVLGKKSTNCRYTGTYFYFIWGA